MPLKCHFPTVHAAWLPGLPIMRKIMRLQFFHCLKKWILRGMSSWKKWLKTWQVGRQAYWTESAACQNLAKCDSKKSGNITAWENSGREGKYKHLLRPSTKMVFFKCCSFELSGKPWFGSLIEAFAHHQTSSWQASTLMIIYYRNMIKTIGKP